MNMITNNEFLQNVLENSAWEKVSESEALSMDMLEMYQGKLDWEAVAKNNEIVWTIEGVKKFARRLDWSEFSWHCPDSFISETTLREFRDKWDWKLISNRECVYNDWALLEIFADDIDWATVITNWNIEKPVEFLKKFHDRIPMDKLQDSRLWETLVDIRAKQLKVEIIVAK